MIRGLLSLYPIAEVKEYLDVIPHGGSSSKNLREAFQELKGVSIPTNLESLLEERLLKKL